MGFASRRIRATWASPVIAYGSPRKCSLHDSGRAGAHARRSFGRIIISSVVGETGAFGQANYAASKSGLHSGLSRSGGLRVHMVYSVRVKLAVRITARFADSRPFCPVARAPGLLVWLVDAVHPAGWFV